MQLTDLVKVYDALDPALCRRMIEKFERHPEQQFRNRTGQIEVNLVEHAASWRDELERLPAILFSLWERYTDDTGVRRGVTGLPNTFGLEQPRMKKYQADHDDEHALHVDVTCWTNMNRHLVCLCYLNDVEQGGETEFVSLGLSVRPRTGAVLMFPPYWMFPHRGVASRSGDKYIVSTYMQYQPTPAEVEFFKGYFASL